MLDEYKLAKREVLDKPENNSLLNKWEFLELVHTNRDVVEDRFGDLYAHCVKTTRGLKLRFYTVGTTGPNEYSCRQGLGKALCLLVAHDSGITIQRGFATV